MASGIGVLMFTEVSESEFLGVSKSILARPEWMERAFLIEGLQDGAGLLFMESCAKSERLALKKLLTRH